MGSPLTANAMRVLESRYLRRTQDRLESADELFARVARAVAAGELAFGSARAAAEWEQTFYERMSALELMPNSPTLMNAGTPLGQLSACFVIPVEDSIDAIFEALKCAALVQRTGGGTGFSFSALRPTGDPLSSTGGQAAGPVAFMRIFDCMTEQVKQAGRRRGANMGVLRVDHPDVLELVTAKARDAAALRNFNVSVGVTDAFMVAVHSGGDHELRSPRSGRTLRTVRARALFDAIVDAAWQVGDPGLLFLDAIARANPTPALGAIEATNPCGEVPLLPWEACTLGSINLARMLREDRRGLDMEKLRRTARQATRFLDDVVEVNRMVLPVFERAARLTRKIGLGVMGFAELLLTLGISYDSDEAVRLGGEISAAIEAEAFAASVELARERGPFPAFNDSSYAAGPPLRNATRTAIAPTGTLSIIAGTTPSIEPLYALAYRRAHVLGGETLHEANPFVAEALARAGVSPALVLDAVAAGRRLADIDGLTDGVRHLLATALEIPTERHLAMQAAFQAHVDNAVSKTINMPREATRDDVAAAYLRAHELGLKGITIYRSGSRSHQVLEIGAGEIGGIVEHASRCDAGECRL